VAERFAQGAGGGSAVFAVEEIFHGLAAGFVGFALSFAVVGG
jgi:hypothetical protein